MIDIDNTLISHDVIQCPFACDLPVCRGACCVHGDSGAPLEKEEAVILRKALPGIKPFLRKEGIEAIHASGTSVTDSEGDIVTPLINGQECAYAIFENGIARCGIEKAFHAGAIGYRKSISCHLYPVRIRKYKNYYAVNYDRWAICKPAITKGENTHIPVYRFVEEALIRKFGREWFEKLIMIARGLDTNKIPL
ncbi:MAG: DUF3109 family protein [Bacteroidales bacterium]|nr:DUF3109 family protein [Bacteroidales bacterium]